MFKYDESATGVEVAHSPHLQALSVGLSPWASDADVQLFAAFVNAFLAKHKRARLYEGAAPLGGLSDDDVRQMIEERRAYLQELLSTQESITMEGLRAGATLGVAEFRAAVAPDQQVCELQRQFIEMQWE